MRCTLAVSGDDYFSAEASRKTLRGQLSRQLERRAPVCTPAARAVCDPGLQRGRVAECVGL
jgi:hypothetical protein